MIAEISGAIVRTNERRTKVQRTLFERSLAITPLGRKSSKRRSDAPRNRNATAMTRARMAVLHFVNASSNRLAVGPMAKGNLPPGLARISADVPPSANGDVVRQHCLNASATAQS